MLADNASNYSKDTFVNANFKESLADGLLVSEGDTWKRRRRLIQPAFHRERLVGYADAMVEDATRIADRWEPLAGTDEPIDLAVEMGTLTLLITARVLFGVDLTEGRHGGPGHRRGLGAWSRRRRRASRPARQESWPRSPVSSTSGSADDGARPRRVSMLVESRDDTVRA